MPAIQRFPRTQDDSICPPARPFCTIPATINDDSYFNSQNRSSSSANQGANQALNRPVYSSGKYAGLIIVLALAGIAFLLWLTWAQWPRTKAKALWKMRKGREKEDKGIHSSEPQKDKTFDMQGEPIDSTWIPGQDGVMVDLELDEDYDFEPEAAKQRTEVRTK